MQTISYIVGHAIHAIHAIHAAPPPSPKLKRPWPGPGGVTELVMAPVDFLARLTALIPALHVNLVRYHGAQPRRSTEALNPE
jgi:hypothetical protein